MDDGKRFVHVHDAGDPRITSLRGITGVVTIQGMESNDLQPLRNRIQTNASVSTNTKAFFAART